MYKRNKIPIQALEYTFSDDKDNKTGGIRCFINLGIGDLLHINSISVMPDRYDNNKLYINWPRNQLYRGKSFFEFPDAKNNPLLRAMRHTIESAYGKCAKQRITKLCGDIAWIGIDELSSFKPTTREVLPDADEIGDEEITMDEIPFD